MVVTRKYFSLSLPLRSIYSACQQCRNYDVRRIRMANGRHDRKSNSSEPSGNDEIDQILLTNVPKIQRPSHHSNQPLFATGTAQSSTVCGFQGWTEIFHRCTSSGNEKISRRCGQLRTRLFHHAEQHFCQTTGACTWNETATHRRTTAVLQRLFRRIQQLFAAVGSVQKAGFDWGCSDNKVVWTGAVGSEPAFNLHQSELAVSDWIIQVKNSLENDRPFGSEWYLTSESFENFGMSESIERNSNSSSWQSRTSSLAKTSFLPDFIPFRGGRGSVFYRNMIDASRRHLQTLRVFEWLLYRHYFSPKV